MAYAGARGTLDVSSAARLAPSRYALQPKVDGMYVELALDSEGRIARVTSRTGAEVASSLTGHLLGAWVGAPGAVLAGELEAHTEAGNRAALARGWRAVHLFDALRGAGGEPLASLPYRARRDALWRMQSAVQCEAGSDRPWRAEAEGRLRGPGGRFCRAVPRSWRLTPIVEQLRPERAAELWARAEVGELEGFVAVALDAPLGARNGKRKVKPTSTIDATVVDLDARRARLLWCGYTFIVSRGRFEIAIGDIVEVAHSGFYEREVIPRFARIVRVRHDLTPQSAHGIDPVIWPC
jgi:hypothetical protein